MRKEIIGNATLYGLLIGMTWLMMAILIWLSILTFQIGSFVRAKTPPNEVEEMEREVFEAQIYSA